MKIRLGYVGISKTIDKTSSSIITYTEYLKKEDFSKLESVIISNFLGLECLLKYNIKNDISFFRMTSKLIPLATKDEVVFDYITPYKKYFDKLSGLCKNIRIDMHPDQYTVLNSVKEEVVLNSIKNLEYHYNILSALGVKNKVILIHVGSSFFGKEKSITRFINTFKKLPLHLQKSIAIENDDKVFNIKDCLYISSVLNIPFVLDYHHYNCNNDGEDIDDYFVSIFNTWKVLKPKIHFSSPKSKLKKEFRSHHDYINVNEFIIFLERVKKYNVDVDVMLEAKAKDEALFRLIRQLKYLDYKIEGTTIIL